MIPGSSRPVPDGAMVSGADLAAVQNLTEDDVRGRLSSKALVPWESARESFFDNIIGGIGDALKQGLAGVANSVGSWAGSIFEAGKQVKDGQEELNDRTDLLLPFMDRGSLYMDPVSGWSNSGVMPFNRQIGPMQNLTFIDSGMRLEDVGQWEIEAQLTASWVRFVTSEVTWRVRVLNPDGSLFSEQRYTMSNANNMTMSVTTDVVVKAPGCLVQVEILTIGAGRAVLGGAPWNRLTVRHLNRTINVGEDGSGVATNNPDNPDGNISGEDSPDDSGGE
ncbi:hypothetical protein [Corynebacterium kalidii]